MTAAQSEQGRLEFVGGPGPSPGSEGVGVALMELLLQEDYLERPKCLEGEVVWVMVLVVQGGDIEDALVLNIASAESVSKGLSAVLSIADSGGGSVEPSMLGG